MARKTLNYTIKEEGRDKGKQFLITEMSALSAAKWACKVFLAVAASGVELPEGAEQAGLAGLAAIGVRMLAKLRWEDAEPLFDEVMQCIQVVPDPSRPHVVRSLIEEDIEEVQTHFILRKEIIGIHLGF